MSNFVIYGRNDCKSCALVRDFLDSKLVSYQYHDWDRISQERSVEILENNPFSNYLPILMLDGSWISLDQFTDIANKF